MREGKPVNKNKGESKQMGKLIVVSLVIIILIYTVNKAIEVYKRMEQELKLLLDSDDEHYWDGEEYE